MGGRPRAVCYLGKSPDDGLTQRMGCVPLVVLMHTHALPGETLGLGGACLRPPVCGVRLPCAQVFRRG